MIVTDIAGLTDAVAEQQEAGDRFAALFATAEPDERLRLTALLAVPGGIEPLEVTLAAGAASYPSLTPTVPSAFWYERELHDLFGIVPQGHPRLDPLVLPLPEGSARPRPGSAKRPWSLQPDEHILPRLVVGTGLFTIPHGPVRSGVFESVEYLVETPGEDIPQLRVRVYAKHRGIEKRFEDLPLDQGILLAERAEGIASVAHALAYAHAIESLAGIQIPAAAALIRVVHAELERIANHLDVAMKLADAAGLAVATARFGTHKEHLLRLTGRLCGSRFGRGVVAVGGVHAAPALPPAELLAALDPLEVAISSDLRLLLATSSFLDRLRRTGILEAGTAVEHGALGPVGRASGVHDDTRRHRPYDAYPMLSWQTRHLRPSGDAQARLMVRVGEIGEAFDLIRAAVARLAGLDASAALRVQGDVPDGRGIGWAEAPQGELLYVVEVRDGRIHRCKPRSASFHNLALFAHTFGGDILTDFPFIEASFGVSMAGVVL